MARRIYVFKIFVNTTGNVTNLALHESKLIVGHALHEISIVRNHQKRSRPAVKQIFKNGQHIGVQIIARLIKYQDVWLFEKRQTSPLSA